MLFSSVKLWGTGVQRWWRGQRAARITLADGEWFTEPLAPGRPSRSLTQLFFALRRTQGRRDAVLEIIVTHVDELNHRDVSLPLRCLHIAVSEIYARPAIASVWTEFSARDENPESDVRKSLTTAAIGATRVLARGYRRIVQEMQRVPEKTYTLCQAHLWPVTHRIFELVQAEQHLSALRRMKLDAGAWREMNRLYFALHDLPEAAERFEIAGYLRKPQRAQWLPQRATELVSHASIRQLYVAIQVTGMIDPPSWSAQQFTWVQAYLGRSLMRLKLHSPSIRIAGAEIVVVTPDRPSAPHAGVESPDRGRGLHIDLGPLLRRIVHDIEQQGMGKDMRHAQRNRMLSTLSGGERWQLLERLSRKLRYQDGREPRTEVQQFVDLDVRWGCAAVFAALKDGMPPPADPETDKPWYLVNESRDGMLFRFNAAAGAKPQQFVGQLVTFLRQLDSNRCDTLQIGYVTRVQRDRSGVVDVAVQRIAGEAEPAALRSNPRGADEISALVARFADGKWRIVMHSRQASSTLARMFLRHDDRVMPLKLGKMFLYQTEFVVFDLEQFDHL